MYAVNKYSHNSKMIFILVHAVRISEGPEDAYAVRGSQAELSCVVTDQGPQDYVLWKKV